MLFGRQPLVCFSGFLYANWKFDRRRLRMTLHWPVEIVVLHFQADVH